MKIFIYSIIFISVFRYSSCFDGSVFYGGGTSYYKIKVDSVSVKSFVNHNLTLKFFGGDYCLHNNTNDNFDHFDLNQNQNTLIFTLWAAEYFPGRGLGGSNDPVYLNGQPDSVSNINSGQVIVRVVEPAGDTLQREFNVY